MMNLFHRVIIFSVVFAFSAFPATSQESKEDEAMRTKLSTLWMVESVNIVGADVLSSYIPGAQEEVEDVAGGKKNVKYFMLGGALIYEIPFSMIFLSRYMPYKVNRWVNVGAAAFTALAVIGGGSLEPHYIFMASVETLTLSLIAWNALKWPDPEAKDKGTGLIGDKHDLGLRLNSKTGLYGLAYAYRF